MGVGKDGEDRGESGGTVSWRILRKKDCARICWTGVNEQQPLAKGDELKNKRRNACTGRHYTSNENGVYLKGEYTWWRPALEVTNINYLSQN